MKKWLSVIVLCVGLMTANAFAAGWLYDSCSVPVGNWAGTHEEGEDTVWNWVEIGSVPWPPGTPQANKPTGEDEVLIRYPGTEVTINTDESWNITGTEANRGRIRVYGGAKLTIESGAKLTDVGWMRVGESSGGATLHGTVVQTGGLLELGKSKDKGKLVIGDKMANVGSSYTISGGTIGFSADADGQLFIGGRGGKGKFVVDGTGAVIQLKNLYVGSDGTSVNNAGQLEFKVGASGVAAIQLAGTTTMEQATGDSAELIVTLTAAPPVGDILLVDNTTSMAGTSVFDMVNGVAGGEEGDLVTLTFGANTYYYLLTYVGGTDGKDIVLVVPEPATIALLSLGLLAIRRRK